MLTAAALLCTLLLLALGTVMLAREARTVRETVSLQSELNSGIAQMQTVLALLGDAEAGQRGYLLTGSDRFLQPYRAAVAKLPSILASLDTIPLEDPALSEHIGSLRDLSSARLAELARPVALNEDGHRRAALDLVRAENAQHTMERARREVAACLDVIRSARDALGPRVISGALLRERLALATMIALVVAALLAAVQVGTQLVTQSRHESARRHLTEVFDATPDYVAQTDGRGQLQYLNPAARRALGVGPAESLDGHLYSDFFTHETNERFASEIVPDVHRHGVWVGETSVRLAQQGVEPVSHMVIAHRDGSGSIARYTSLMRNISGEVGARRELAQHITTHREESLRLRRLSERDALTGLLNRVGFEAYIRLESELGQGSLLAVLYIDLDHFKPINDLHGHAAGDEVLRQFASRLKSAVRPTDGVARLGGDEFGVVLPGVREPEDAARVADKIVNAAREPFQVGSLSLVVSASVGVAFNAEMDGGWKGLVDRADAMVYQAKAAGRGQRALAAGA
jgi:diguanylate cyclase (GGDEF)-like protein